MSLAESVIVGDGALDGEMGTGDTLAGLERDIGGQREPGGRSARPFEAVRQGHGETAGMSRGDQLLLRAGPALRLLGARRPGHRLVTDARGVEGSDAAVAAAGGRVFASIGSRVDAYEAGIAERVVLIEFDSFELAVAARARLAYQKALAELPDGFERDFRIIEGRD